MATNKEAVGRLGEDIAEDFLLRKGYRLIERNFRKPWGEIDIVANRGDSVRFVEVKTRTISRSDISRENSRPEELLHVTKIRKLARTAALYMEAKGDDREFQIDAVVVLLDEQKRTAKCRLYEQVVDEL